MIKRFLLALMPTVVAVTVVATGVAAIVVTTDTSRGAAALPASSPSVSPAAMEASPAEADVSAPVVAPTGNPEAFGDGRAKASDWVLVEFPPKPAAGGGGGKSAIFATSGILVKDSFHVEKPERLTYTAWVSCYGAGGTVSGTMTVKSESKTQTVKLPSQECLPRESGPCVWWDWIDVPSGDSNVHFSVTFTHSSGAKRTESVNYSI